MAIPATIIDLRCLDVTVDSLFRPAGACTNVCFRDENWVAY